MKKILKVLKAFTLIELLISIVAIALVTASMSPMITKKVKASRTIVNADDVRTKPFCNKFSEGCELCYPKKCIICEKDCGEVATQFGMTSSVLNKDLCRCTLCNSGKPTTNPIEYDYNTVTTDPHCYSCTFGNGQCQGCMPGYYLSNGKCQECPEGHYCEGGNKSKQQCKAGTYQDKKAQKECLDCPEGQMNTGKGNTTCTKCSPGYYQNKPGQSSCKSCEGSKGKYSATSGAKKCSDCPAGNIVNTTAAATSCTQCKPGYYATSTGWTACSGCPAGQSAQSSGCSTCTKCSPGYYASGTANTSCKPCPVGKYASNSGWSACSNCPVGKYATGAASVCTDCESISGCAGCVSTNGNCTSCKAGYKNVNNATCSKCDAGYYSTEGSATCSQCKAGTSSKKGASACSVCSKGYYSSKGSASCTACPEGTKGTKTGLSVCTPCAAGYYNNTTALTSNCFPCPVGQRTGASTTGATSCTKCKAGYYNDTEALAGTCSACGTGKYSKSGASSCKTCVENCKVCATTSTCQTCKDNFEKQEDGKKCVETEITPTKQSDCDDIAGATGKLVYLSGKNRCATVNNVTYGDVIGKTAICETKNYCCWKYDSNNKVCNSYAAAVACNNYSLGSNKAGSFKLISESDLKQLFKESKGNTCNESQCGQDDWCLTGTQHPWGSDGSCEPYIYYHDQTTSALGIALAKISYNSKGYLSNNNNKENKGQAIRCTIGKAKVTKRL